MSKNNGFTSLNDFRDSIDMGLDIDCNIYGERYYIGAPQGKLLIALSPNGDDQTYDNVDDLLNNHKIRGKLLKDIWFDIEINSM